MLAGFWLISSQGRCKFGDGCTKKHIMANTERFKISSDYTTQQPLSRVLSQVAANQFNPRSVAALLPAFTAETEGLIPINENGERIDTVLPRPTSTAWELYKERTRKQKLCNAHH